MNFGISGATYLLFSVMFCVAIFEPVIAFCAMAYVSIGDTFAALVGMTWGKRKFKGMNKSLEGSLACFVSTFVFGLFFLGSPITPRAQPVLALVGALTATIAELVNIPVDDNVKIPILSGLALTLAGIVA